MRTPISDAILHVIQQAGFSVGMVRLGDGWHVSAIRPDGGERWAVVNDDLQAAVIELARQVGIELEE